MPSSLEKERASNWKAQQKSLISVWAVLLLTKYCPIRWWRRIKVDIVNETDSGKIKDPWNIFAKVIQLSNYVPPFMIHISVWLHTTTHNSLFRDRTYSPFAFSSIYDFSSEFNSFIKLCIIWLISSLPPAVSILIEPSAAPCAIPIFIWN